MSPPLGLFFNHLRTFFYKIVTVKVLGARRRLALRDAPSNRLDPPLRKDWHSPENKPGREHPEPITGSAVRH
jgi:hypothetical protein